MQTKEVQNIWGENFVSINFFWVVIFALEFHNLAKPKNWYSFFYLPAICSFITSRIQHDVWGLTIRRSTAYRTKVRPSVALDWKVSIPRVPPVPRREQKNVEETTIWKVMTNETTQLKKLPLTLQLLTVKRFYTYGERGRRQWQARR